MPTVKEQSRIARFVESRINELIGSKNQREIAEISGFKNQNMITMIKQGYTKVAVDRVFDLAKALETDPKPLMRMALEQFYTPHALKDIERAFSPDLAPDEHQLLDAYRKIRGKKPPALPADLSTRLAELIH